MIPKQDHAVINDSGSDSNSLNLNRNRDRLQKYWANISFHGVRLYFGNSLLTITALSKSNEAITLFHLVPELGCTSPYLLFGLSFSYPAKQNIKFKGRMKNQIN